MKSIPHEFGLMPFWFWNDRLDAGEIARQIADFEAHGCGGFVIHPRVGLPRELGFMSDPLLDFMQLAIEDADRRGMKVILYDEGMYPSGSASGLVVARDPSLHCRCLATFPLDQDLPADANEIVRLESRGVRVIDRKVDAYIRGLHYIDESRAEEDEPPAGDILNPRTTAAVIELVYDRFFERFGRFFGRTILGIFTDEPDPLGKCRERKVAAGTTGIVEFVSKTLGRDVRNELGKLFFDDEPDARAFREDYDRAIRRRMDETWYEPLSNWCEAHEIWLCGHPRDGDDLASMRHFHVPGQDIVWRFIEPDKPSALEGPQSTQGKVTSSAMLHLNRRRNSNEFCGAYGNETTFDEFRFLANWLLVRGVNLLIPHAFYYSVRGPRREERPPDVGPNSAWWNDFKPFADACRFACWVNTDSLPDSRVAIVCDPHHAPWRAAKELFIRQIDFDYLDFDSLDRATISNGRVSIARMNYEVCVIEPNTPDSVRERIGGANVIEASGDWIDRLLKLVRPVVKVESKCDWLRTRRVAKDGQTFLMLFNESLRSNRAAIDGHDVSFGPAELKVIEVGPDGAWRL